jgi:hypothetical protein
MKLLISARIFALGSYLEIRVARLNAIYFLTGKTKDALISLFSGLIINFNASADHLRGQYSTIAVRTYK